jgi:hypothetical protein
MTEIDKRHILENEIFTYRKNKDGRVFISWRGKQVMILKGKETQKFIARIKNLNDHEAQLIMARATGNFKHGNEH